uniref:NADH dehydrogenase subunit 4L n=1 Tax=Ooencyrtus plautus TaxID=2989845 RepID=UPI0022383EC3|nr:NADH dehydrogenase subunit 4L [Ooencyrtus plautus]UYP50997.1 NADH dehydrogenase subunit 4L [Ooencyrtus plautus]
MYLNYYLYFYMFVMNLFLYSSMFQFLMLTLMSLEFLMLSTLMLMMMNFMFLNMENFILFFLIFIVCESVLGLTLLLMLIRNQGNDNSKILLLNLW